jgi:Helix-turn-helix domain
MGNEDFYTLEVVAEKLGVTVRYLSDKIGDGSLKASKIGKRLYVLHSSVVDLIKANEVKAEKTKRVVKADLADNLKKKK